jgi:hypothetical protein
VGSEIVENDDIALCQARSELRFDVVSKMRRFIGASTTKGAVSPWQRSPAMKVCVFSMPERCL